MNNLIASYYKFVCLPDEVRATNKINSKARLDCVLFTDMVPSYKGLTNFVNAKGQLFFYKGPAKGILKANSRRMAEWTLTHGSLNVSSIYIEDAGFGYGYPNAKHFLSNGSPNPLFNFRSDGYLFIVNKDLSEIELLIILDGKNMISSYYSQLIDGELDEEIGRLRNEAKAFFKYLPPVQSGLELGL